MVLWLVLLICAYLACGIAIGYQVICATARGFLTPLDMEEVVVVIVFGMFCGAMWPIVCVLVVVNELILKPLQRHLNRIQLATVDEQGE